MTNATAMGEVRKVLHGVKIADCPPELREKLQQYDTNGNGIIDPNELPDPMSAEMTYLKVSSFPKKVQPLLNEIDDEKNGKIEMDELTDILTVYSDLKKANKEGSIAIKTLPKEIQATLKVFDVDGDGTVAPMELARGAELYKESKKTAKRLMVFSGVLLVILCALVGVIVGLTAVVVEASKETKTDGSGITTVKGTSTVAATAAVVKTRTLYDAFKMPSSQLDGITSLMLTNKGRTYKHTITGFEKMPNKVVFFSARGDTVEATPNAITVKDSSGIPRFQKMSSEESRRRRELLANDGGSSNNNEDSMTQTQTQSSDGAECWDSSDKTSCSGNAKCLWMPDSYCSLNFDNFVKSCEGLTTGEACKANANCAWTPTTEGEGYCSVDFLNGEKIDKAFATCDGLKTGEACKTNPYCEFTEYGYCMGSMEQFECSMEEVPDGQGFCKAPTTCATTQYMVADFVSKTTDRICKTVTICDTKKKEVETKAPTATTDRVCEVKLMSTCESLTVRTAVWDPPYDFHTGALWKDSLGFDPEQKMKMRGCPAANCAAPEEYAQHFSLDVPTRDVVDVPLTGSQLPPDWTEDKKEPNCRSCESIVLSEETKKPIWKSFEADAEELNMSVCSALGCAYDTSLSPAARTCTTCDQITGKSIAECVRYGCGYMPESFEGYQKIYETGSGSGGKCTSCWQVQGDGAGDCYDKYGCSQVADILGLSDPSTIPSGDVEEFYTIVAPSACRLLGDGFGPSDSSMGELDGPAAVQKYLEDRKFGSDIVHDCQCQPMESFMISYMARLRVRNPRAVESQCSMMFYGGKHPKIDAYDPSGKFCHHCSYFEKDGCDSVGCGEPLSQSNEKNCRNCIKDIGSGETCEDSKCMENGGSDNYSGGWRRYGQGWDDNDDPSTDKTDKCKPNLGENIF